MKKVLSLVMALAIMLSLVACGGSGDSVATETTVPPTTEDPSQNAVPLDYQEIYDTFADNQIKGEDTYYNNYYLVTGAVRRINSDSVDIQLIDVAYSASMVSLCNVKLPRDDLKNISTFDVITVSGKITHFDSYMGSLSIKMEDGHYVDNVIEITGDVTSYHAFSDNMNTMYAEISDIAVTNGNITRNYFDIEIPNCDPYVGQNDTVTINNVSMKQGDTITFSGIMKMNADYGTNKFIITNLKSIKQG